MISEANPVADRVSESESASPTVNELIFQLQSSFFPHELNYVAKTLTDREECMKQKYLDLKLKANEEIGRLVSENLKLNDELKTKQIVIDAVKKMNAEKWIKIRDYEKRYLDEREFKANAEKEKERLVLENLKLTEELKKKKYEIDAVSSEYESKFKVYEKQSLELKMKTEAMVHENLKLNEELQKKRREFDAMMKRNSEYESKIRAFENKSLKSDAKVLISGKIAKDTDCAAESSRKFSEKGGSRRKATHNLHEIIEINDDDDDDDDELVSRTKRRQACNEKTELKYSARLFKLNLPKQK